MVIIEKDISKLATKISNSDGTADRTIESIQEQLKEFCNNENILDAKSKISIRDIKKGQKFYGTITTTVKDPKTGKKVRTQITSTFEMLDNKRNTDRLLVKDIEDGNIYNTSRRGTKLLSKTLSVKQQEAKRALEEALAKIEKERKLMQELGIKFSSSDTPTRIKRTIEAGIKNIWLCGPAGSGNKRY